jgi:hypothetical protein
MPSLRTALLGFVAVVAVALVGLPDLAEARRRNRNSQEEVSQFAVEFTCGTNDSSFDGIVPGDYATVVNVHNAGSETRARAMVSLSYPTSSSSDWTRTSFAPMQSRQLDCADILGGTFVFDPPLEEDGYYQGFVIIQTMGDLDVVARYTATGSDGEVSTDVETASPRKVRRKRIRDDDLVEICHVPPGNPDNAHTIEVDPSAVPAHIAHGDYEGRCDGDEAQDEGVEQDGSDDNGFDWSEYISRRDDD